MYLRHSSTLFRACVSEVTWSAAAGVIGHTDTSAIGTFRIAENCMAQNIVRVNSSQVPPLLYHINVTCTKCIRLVLWAQCERTRLGQHSDHLQIYVALHGTHANLHPLSGSNVKKAERVFCTYVHGSPLLIWVCECWLIDRSKVREVVITQGSIGIRK